MKRASKRSRENMTKLMEDKLIECMRDLLPQEVVNDSTESKLREIYKHWSKMDGSQEIIRNATPEYLEDGRKRLKAIPHTLRRYLAGAYKRLPHDPGGRKEVLTDSEKAEVIDKIGRLIIAGDDLARAKEIVARKHAVSLSTVQRVWRERGAKKSAKSKAE